MGIACPPRRLCLLCWLWLGNKEERDLFRVDEFKYNDCIHCNIFCVALGLDLALVMKLAYFLALSLAMALSLVMSLA